MIARTAKAYLATLFSLSAIFYVASLVQVPWLFEEGVYDRYTASILESGDFNLVNQRGRNDPENWLVTQAGSSVDATLVGSTIYLAPFFVSHYVTHRGESDRDVRRFQDVHVLATIFYVMLGLIVLWRTLAHFGVRHFRKSLALFALTPAFLWYFLFASTNTNILGLAYSSVAFTYFALARERGVGPRDFAVLGLAFGLGLTLRQQLFWIGLLPLAVFWEQSRINPRAVGAFIAGAAIPLLAALVNGAVLLGGLRDSLSMQYSTAEEWTPSAKLVWNSLRYDLFGPNGYFYVAPITALAALALPAGWVRGNSFRRALGLIALAPLCILFTQVMTGFLQDTLAGRHFLEFQFFFILLLAAAFENLESRSRAWLRAGVAVALGLSIWQLLVTASYYYLDTHDFDAWFMEPQANFAHARAGVALLAERLSPERFGLAWTKVSSHGLALVLLSGLLASIARLPLPRLRPFLAALFGLGGATFAVFTFMNLMNHARNVETYRNAGLYAGKVVGRSRASYNYDGFVEASRLALRYDLHEGRCDLAAETASRLRRFLTAAKSDVTEDPIGFIRDLDDGIIRPSAWEDLSSVTHLGEDLQQKCGLKVLK